MTTPANQRLDHPALKMPSESILISDQEFKAIRDGLDSLIQLYGRARIPPYPHEHLAWRRARMAMGVIDSITHRARPPKTKPEA
jgi:hypothetical protein